MRTLFVGFSVPIDGVADAPDTGSGRRLLDDLGRVPLHLVEAKPLPTGLLSLTYAVERPGEAGAYVDAAIPLVYRMLVPVIGRLADEGWLVLDTTRLDVAAAVDAIRRHAGLPPAGAPAGADPAAR